MRSILLSVTSSVAVLFLLCGSCFATTREGVIFPEQVSVEGRNLRLNGVGLLQKSIFKADVYVAGLYLQRPARAEQEILASGQLKKLVMVFLRDVSSGQLAGEWKKAFEKGCAKTCDELHRRPRSNHRVVSQLVHSRLVLCAAIEIGEKIKRTLKLSRGS